MHRQAILKKDFLFIHASSDSNVNLMTNILVTKKLVEWGSYVDE